MLSEWRQRGEGAEAMEHQDQKTNRREAMILGTSGIPMAARDAVAAAIGPANAQQKKMSTAIPLKNDQRKGKAAAEMGNCMNSKILMQVQMEMKMAMQSCVNKNPTLKEKLGIWGPTYYHEEMIEDFEKDVREGPADHINEINTDLEQRQTTYLKEM